MVLNSKSVPSKQKALKTQAIKTKSLLELKHNEQQKGHLSKVKCDLDVYQFYKA